MRAYTSLPYTEYPVATGNFSTTGRKKIEQIIIHSTVSTFQSAINWFNNPQAGTSAHYIVSNKGEIAAMLEEYNVAYANGNLTVNQRSISIEHEWYAGLITDNRLYATSAKLVADICREYGLACNRGTVKGHNEIVPTGCPNQISVDRIVKEANLILNPAPITPPESIEQLKQTIADLRETEKRLKAEHTKAIADLRRENEDKLARMRSDLLKEFKEKLLTKLQEIT